MADRPTAPPVAVRLRLSFDDLEAFIQGYWRAVEPGGIYLATTRPREPGTLVRFELTTRTGDRLLLGEGRVISATLPEQGAGTPGMRLRLTRLGSEGREVLDRMLALRHQAQAEAGRTSTGAPRSRTVTGGGLLGVEGAPLAPLGARSPLPQEGGQELEAIGRDLDSLLASSPPSPLPRSSAAALDAELDLTADDAASALDELIQSAPSPGPSSAAGLPAGPASGIGAALAPLAPRRPFPSAPPRTTGILGAPTAPRSPRPAPPPPPPPRRPGSLPQFPAVITPATPTPVARPSAPPAAAPAEPVQPVVREATPLPPGPGTPLPGARPLFIPPPPAGTAARGRTDELQLGRRPSVPPPPSGADGQPPPRLPTPRPPAPLPDEAELEATIAALIASDAQAILGSTTGRGGAPSTPPTSARPPLGAAPAAASASRRSLTPLPTPATPGASSPPDDGRPSETSAAAAPALEAPQPAPAPDGWDAADDPRPALPVEATPPGVAGEGLWTRIKRWLGLGQARSVIVEPELPPLPDLATLLPQGEALRTDLLAQDPAQTGQALALLPDEQLPDLPELPDDAFVLPSRA